jgi:SUR7/PalI family
MASSSLEKRADTSRRHSTVVWHRLTRSLIYLLAWIFLLLVVIGNLANKPVLRDTYFMYLDTANVIPDSVPNAVFINSAARTIGLHDFYQVGLWDFCEGYDDSGITDCSHPKALYWFDPVSIMLNELLSGATSTLFSAFFFFFLLPSFCSHIPLWALD